MTNVDVTEHAYEDILVVNDESGAVDLVQSASVEEMGNQQQTSPLKRLQLSPQSSLTLAVEAAEGSQGTTEADLHADDFNWSLKSVQSD